MIFYHWLVKNKPDFSRQQNLFRIINYQTEREQIFLTSKCFKHNIQLPKRKIRLRLTPILTLLDSKIMFYLKNQKHLGCEVNFTKRTGHINKNLPSLIPVDVLKGQIWLFGGISHLTKKIQILKKSRV